MAEIVTRGKLDDILKGSVIDLHCQKIELGRPAAVRSLSADSQSVAFYGNLQILTAHPGQLQLDYQAIVGHIHIRVGHPMRSPSTFSVTHCRELHKMSGRTYFAHGHYGA